MDQNTKFMNLVDLVKQPDDAIFLDIDFGKGNKKRAQSNRSISPLDEFFAENAPKGKYFFTVGDVKKMADKFDDDEKIIELFEEKKLGDAHLDANKPSDYDTCAEARNEHDEEYHVYRQPLVEYICLKCEFEFKPENNLDNIMYGMVAWGVIQVLSDRHPEWS